MYITYFTLLYNVMCVVEISQHGFESGSNKGIFLSPSIIVIASHVLFSLILTTTLKDRSYYYLHFISEETKAEKD